VVVPEEAAVRGASLAAAYLWAPNEDEQKVCFCRSLVPDCIYRQLHFELMINGKDVIFSMEPRSRTDSLPCTFTVYGGGHGRAIKVDLIFFY
jgi:hypothetical protein